MSSKCNFVFVLLYLLSHLTGGLAGSGWDVFRGTFNKKYENPYEESARRAIFERNIQEVTSFNAKHTRSYTKGINHLLDWTDGELTKLTSGLDLAETRDSPIDRRFHVLKIKSTNRSDDEPASVDWRKVPERVSNVRDQGNCSSSWAFAATGLLEGQQVPEFKFNKLVELSAQNLVDCSTENHGCLSGHSLYAMADIWQAGGINSDASYPYVGKQHRCRFNRSSSVMTVKGAYFLPPFEKVIGQIVAKYGPVAATINVSKNLIHYKSGVFYDEKCSGRFPKHAVLIVGYGTDTKFGDYWLVKNSWGTDWGEQGYLRLARYRQNQCNIASMALWPKF